MSKQGFGKMGQFGGSSDCAKSVKKWDRRVKILAVSVLSIVLASSLPVIVASDSRVVIRVSMEFDLEFDVDSQLIVPSYNITTHKYDNITVGGLGGILVLHSWRISEMSIRFDENLAKMPEDDVRSAVLFGIENDASAYIHKPSLVFSLTGEFRPIEVFAIPNPDEYDYDEQPLSGVQKSFEVPRGQCLSYIKINVVAPSSYKNDAVFDVSFWFFANHLDNQEVGFMSKVITIKKLLFMEQFYAQWYNWYANQTTVAPPVESPYQIEVNVNDIFSITDVFERGDEVDER